MRELINIIDKKLKPMFPNLPTDNLYKFGFVGLVFLLGLLIFVRYNEGITLLKVKNETEIQYGKIQILKLQYEADSDSSKILKRSLNDMIAEVNSKKNSIDNQIGKFNDDKIVFNVAYVILSVFSVTFLILWYHKLQKYQDIIIKKQSENGSIHL